MKLLSRQEEIVLLSIWKLKGNAYGVTIREYISEITRKYWSIGAIYVPLDRLVEKGLVSTYQGLPTVRRGGRSKLLNGFSTASSGVGIEVRSWATLKRSTVISGINKVRFRPSFGTGFKS